MKKTIKDRDGLRVCVSVLMSLPRAYEDPQEPGALGGVRPFAQAHKLKTPQAQQILQSVLSYTLHKPRRTRFPTAPTLVFDRDEQWQMDLVDMQKLRRWNQGNNYLLTVIDVLSKYAWAVPIQSKSSTNMIRGLDKIRRQASPRRPLCVQTDQGKEFLNKKVQAWFKQQGWHHFYTFGDSKASVVERWHRTLKQRMYRYFTAHNTLRYVDVLQPLIHTYNHTYHRSIGMAPHQVTPKTVPDVWERLYGARLEQTTPPPKCRVGDRVRLNKKHRPFKKGYLPGWTEEVFIITHVRRHPIVTYRLSEWDGTPIKGTFYEPDVQKVQVTDDSLFRVEKVLKRQGRRVLVRWKGWPAKYDSWIPAQHGPRQNHPSKKKKAGAVSR